MWTRAARRVLEAGDGPSCSSPSPCWGAPAGPRGPGESCAFLSSCQKALHLLLKHSADVNARDKYWQTPLHVAAANRATKCVEAIIPLLSTVNVADRTGRTALHHAVHSGHLEVGDVGSGTGAPRGSPPGSPPGSGLCRSQRGGAAALPPSLLFLIQMVNLLLNKGASLSTCDKKDRQPIHWAAFLGRFSLRASLHFFSSLVVCGLASEAGGAPHAAVPTPRGPRLSPPSLKQGIWKF